MAEVKFVTAINCMDGRTQEPVIKHMKSRYGADYVDIITARGPVKTLAGSADNNGMEAIKNRLETSLKAHGSRTVGVFAHHDCTGNRVDKDIQLKQLAESIETIRSWGFDCEVAGFWIDENWAVNAII